MAPNIDHLYANTQVAFRSKYLYKNKRINLFADDGRGGEKKQKGESESDDHSSEERESIGETNEFLSYHATKKHPSKLYVCVFIFHSSRMALCVHSQRVNITY